MKIVSFKEKELLKKALDNDEVIAFPTETVFGLGARSSSEKAFENLVKVKNRRPDKPFTLMCGSISQIVDYIEINENTEKLIKKFMPGSITLLVKPKENIIYAKRKALGKNYLTRLKLKIFIRALTESNKDNYKRNRN